MAQSKLPFALIAALGALALSACARTTAPNKKTTVAANQSLVAPNGGFSDKTPAQRRKEWLHSKTGEDD